MAKPADAAEPEPIFKWETMREIRPHVLGYEQPVRGTIVEVELTSGPKVQGFRGEDRQFYFCHGLTFGGKVAPGGPVSPFSGKAIHTILDNHYRPVHSETEAVQGDILVWRGMGDDTSHSAILIEPVIAQGKSYLDDSSRVLTKNGALPEAEMTLGQLIGDEFTYGDSFNVFRRR
ncbi:MAG: hypothetical protein L0Z62_42960 [Gemmataceae bacterium]|nr:hypothetical protein [Gemmataceae bacterium]